MIKPSCVLNRRAMLKGSGALALSPWALQACSTIQNPAVGEMFSHGVASGEPSQRSVLLWTRVSPQSNESAAVVWQLSSDLDFENIIAAGSVNTNASVDFTVKVTVAELQPGTRYYYRFRCNSVESEIGRTRTLPEGKLDTLGLAVSSCSNYPFGYFNVYEAIALDDDVEFVLHLGDYIYEYGAEGYGGDVARRINRVHEPAHEVVSLQDYRLRHAQYKADECSRLMHAAHPLIPTWDDHESANNPYMYGAQNHQQASEGDWYQRRADSLQAFYEWMPVAEPGAAGSREALWRHFEFGDLASLTTLETRHTGRSVQMDYADHLPAIDSWEKRNAFVRDVMWDPSRKMLSSEMEAFLAEKLTDSKAQNSWRMIGNQIPMARTHNPKVQDTSGFVVEGYDPVAEERAQFKRIGELDLPLYTDTWDGYPAAREDFYDLVKAQGLNDMLVLTGDSHSFWANQLYDQQGIAMGLELGTAGVSSPGDFESYGSKTAAMIDGLIADHNREIKWTTCQHRGYLRLKFSPDTVQADYVGVSNVLSRDYRVELVNSVQIARQGETLGFL